MSAQSKTAAILVIGDEILSGRVRDRNIGVIADMFRDLGIDLREVRIVPDEQPEIASALNALRLRYMYVVTTGGLGPTHDDLTADSVATAFGVGIGVDDRARAMLQERHGSVDLTDARLRMARIPFGADLIASPRLKAPGFRLDNVFVLAGVPEIMVAMLEEVRPMLECGQQVHARTLDAGRTPESDYADDLRSIAAANPEVSIGSYPSMASDGWLNSIVVRGRDLAAVRSAEAAVEAMLCGLGSK